jgi:malonyl-CoA O-methyltransferase
VKINNPIKLKKQIAASFGAKISGYGDNAVIQQRLLERLLPSILEHCSPGSIWLDVGCGNCFLERKLHDEHFSGTIFAFDIALQSLLFCKNQLHESTRWLCADIDAAPFKAAMVDGIVCASVLQWSENLDRALQTISALLKPRGYFIFSLFTSESFRQLTEMRKRFNLPTSIILPQHRTIDELLDRNGFSCCTTEDFSDTLYFPSAMALLKHLSAIGSTNVSSQRMSRTSLLRFCSEFEAVFRTSQGIPLTYSALLGYARKEPHHA